MVVHAELTTADGYAESATAIDMLTCLPTSARRRTVAGDKGYDNRDSSPTSAARVHPQHRANTSRQRSGIHERTCRGAAAEAARRHDLHSRRSSRCATTPLSAAPIL